MKEHLTLEGLFKIVAIKASINLGLSNDLKVAFKNIIPAERPLVENKKVQDPYWLVGFRSPESCFYVNIQASKTNSFGFNVNLEFNLIQHVKDQQLMKSLVNYWGCGKYYFRANRDFE